MARVVVVSLMMAALIVLPIVTPPLTDVAVTAVVGSAAAPVLAALPLVGSAEATERRRCLWFVLLCGGAGTVLQIAWSVALVYAAHSP